MLGRALLWASESPRMQRFVSTSRLSRPVVERFVAGDTLADAVRAIEQLNTSSIGGILDLLGEGVSEPSEADQAAEEYLASVAAIRESGIRTTISVKLTQLGLAFEPERCVERLRGVIRAAEELGVGIEVDMEQLEFVGPTLEVYRTLREDHEDVRLAIQAYLRRTLSDLESLADLKPKVRLVKGAYSEEPEHAFQKRSEIDAHYKELIDWLFEHGSEPAIGSHDGAMIAHAQQAAERTGVGKDGFEIQMLYGIRRDYQESLAADGYRVKVYVPFGAAWYPYLMRRMAERPANLRFVLRAMVGG